ncbi:MAG: uracil-DNA glycosylase family protein, partial [Candidatus Hecatellaceae archaeon]
MSKFKLESLISSCQRCTFIDKPFLKYGAYRWLPAKVKVLAVGESPPPGKKESVFYNLEGFDRLRLALKLILNIWDDRGVLETLKENEVFVTAAVKCRPPGFGAIPKMRLNCTRILAEEIRLLKPRRLLAMGRTASASISEILKVEAPSKVDEMFNVEVDGLEVFFTPH